MKLLENTCWSQLGRMPDLTQGSRLIKENYPDGKAQSHPDFLDDRPNNNLAHATVHSTS